MVASALHSVQDWGSNISFAAYKMCDLRQSIYMIVSFTKELYELTLNQFLYSAPWLDSEPKTEMLYMLAVDYFS